MKDCANVMGEVSQKDDDTRGDGGSKRARQGGSGREFEIMQERTWKINKKSNGVWVSGSETLPSTLIHSLLLMLAFSCSYSP